MPFVGLSNLLWLQKSQRAPGCLASPIKSCFHIVKFSQQLSSCFHWLWGQDLHQNYPPAIGYGEYQFVLFPIPVRVLFSACDLTTGAKVLGRRLSAGMCTFPHLLL